MEVQLEENCGLREIDNVQGQISFILLDQMEAIVFIILQIFFTRHFWKLENIPLGNIQEYLSFQSIFFLLCWRAPRVRPELLRGIFRYCLFIHLSFYEKGSEAIDWFIANGFATTRHEGIQIGQVCKLHCNIKLKNSYYSQTGEIDITDW